MATREAIIRERGNGLPDVGDFVSGGGEVYTVVALAGRIHIGASGSGDYIHAEVELADWSDVDDDNEPKCSVEFDDDEDDEGGQR